MLKENYIPWKRRKIQEEIRKEKENQIEEEIWERTKRLNRAKWKKRDLLEEIERKKKEGKPIEWIKKKQKYWRKYRERVEVDEDEMEEIRSRILLMIPERKKVRESSVMPEPTRNGRKGM